MTYINDIVGGFNGATGSMGRYGFMAGYEGCWKCPPPAACMCVNCRIPDVAPDSLRKRRNPRGKRLYQIDTFNPEKPYIHNGICFDHVNGSGATGNTANVNYAGFVAFIEPQTFSKLAYQLHGELERESRDFFVKTLPTVEWCIGPGSLSIWPEGYNSWGDSEPNLNSWEVRGHEGRHRALALRDLRMKTIPVCVFPLQLRSRDVDAKFLQTTNLLRNEDRDDWVSLNAKFFVINKKVCVLASSQEEADIRAEKWLKPLTIQTLRQKTLLDEERDLYFYWSKPDPDAIY